MIMTTKQSIITIAVIILGTMITRFLPFIIFPEHKIPPKYIQYLGKTLPTAVIGLLVVYSLKDISILEGSRGIPELITITIISLLYIWKRNSLLSIFSGTITYMILVQYIFK